MQCQLNRRPFNHGDSQRVFDQLVCLSCVRWRLDQSIDLVQSRANIGGHLVSFRLVAEVRCADVPEFRGGVAEEHPVRGIAVDAADAGRKNAFIDGGFHRKRRGTFVGAQLQQHVRRQDSAKASHNRQRCAAFNFYVARIHCQFCAADQLRRSGKVTGRKQEVRPHDFAPPAPGRDDPGHKKAERQKAKT